jgi:hypothetical protein
MLTKTPHRQHASRLPIPTSLPLPGLPHRNGHEQHTRAIALASLSAGLVVGTAAGAIVFSGRHPSPAEDEAGAGAEE